ncbi:hypothetical protein JCM14469_27140 [Desulfatiferula olefinivorans]
MKRRYLFFSLIGVLFMTSLGHGAFDSASFANKDVLEISRITPEGDDVPPARQIVIQFNQTVVPLGRMEREASEIPVTVSPDPGGQWRWLNTSALACQLDGDHALKPSTVYTVTVGTGLLDPGGKALSSPVVHRFTTLRPALSYYHFMTWNAPGHPVIRLTFNQPVTGASVERRCDLRHGKTMDRHTGLRAFPDPDDTEPPLMSGEQEARRTWLIEPVTPLPEDGSVELWSTPGLVSALGPETGVEERVLVRFDTFPEFRFVGVECRVHDRDESVLVPAEGGKKAAAIKADPLSSVYLVFTAPVIPEAVRDGLSVVPDLAGGRTDYDPWAGVYSYSRLSAPHRKGQHYHVRLPELLQADQAYHLAENVFGIKDEFGRTLKHPIGLTLFTDHRKPDYELVHRVGVLEDAVPTDLPIVVTNMDRITMDYRTMTADGRTDHNTTTRTIPPVRDVAYFYPLGIRELLNGKSGTVFGTLGSRPEVRKHEGETGFFVQVTPFQVFAKIGHFNTLVWVTDLSTGEPVPDAAISLVTGRIDRPGEGETLLAGAVTGDDGTAVLPGNETLDPSMTLNRWGWRLDDGDRMMIRVVQNDRMALLPLAPDFEVDTYRVSNYSVSSGQYPRYGHIRAWGTTAQGVYRAGDTIRYKIYVRNQDNRSLTSPPPGEYALTVTDPMGKSVLERKPIRLSEFGAVDGELTIPKTGAVGWYRFELSADFTGDTWMPMEVLVSDFTPSPFRVSSELSGDSFTNGDAVDVTVLARLHAGGPYADAAARITARLEARSFQSDHPVAKEFYFDTQAGTLSAKTVFDDQKTLDGKGDLTARFTLDALDVVYGRLQVESQVRDDRGKSVASMSRADYWGRTRLVGLTAEKWVHEQDKPVRIRSVVVNRLGVPEPGVPIDLRVERQVTRASRVKGAGNAYLTHYTHEWDQVDRARITSSKEGGVHTFTPDHSGVYRVTAEIKDAKGLSHSTEYRTWVIGPGRVLWEEPEGYSLDIIPEQVDFKVGDTARYLVKNPWPGALALITMERYGVLKHWTRVLESGTPLIEIPVTEDALPGFFLSVTVVSPRVEAAPDDGQADLGKPAFRTGYVATTVNDPYKAVRVDVTPDKAVYRPGDRVSVAVRAQVVHPRDGDPEKLELAVAVLDEAVFDLIAAGRNHFDPYAGFNSVDGLDLMNYSLISQLIGIRKFEKKGASPGGDGGAAISMRSVFDYVSYWNPSLETDDEGKAVFDFTAPDNLTGWRVFVMAVTPTDRMGLGDEGFKVNKPTELRPVMPNQVTSGDRFKAGFTVMNRTDKPRTLSVAVRVEGSLDPEASPAELSQKMTCPPFERKTVFLPVTAGEPGTLTFTATARDRKDGDGLVHHVPVKPRRHLETAAAWGTTTEDAVEEPIRVPDRIEPGTGSLSLTVSPTVLGHLSGAFAYMQHYPYSCWEQKLSRATAAAYYRELRPYLPATLSWDGAEDLVTETLDQAADFQTPSGAMAFYLPEDAYGDPYLSAFTALCFNWLKQAGYAVPETVETRLHGYLNDMLKREILPDFYSRGMAAVVRAVSLCALSADQGLTVRDLERYASHLPRMSLFGKAMFMQAALNTKDADHLAVSACTMILAQADQTGGKVMFSEQKDDGYLRMLATPLRDNAAILSALTVFGERARGREKVGDIPFRLVRALTQTRGNRDHWENTQENLFCMKALADYARVYETEAPRMEVKAFVDNVRIGKAAFENVTDPAETFVRPLTGDDIGKEALLTVSREGTGRLYYSPRLSFATVDEAAERKNAGVDIRREISVEKNGSWTLLGKDARIGRGELVRVDLFVSLPSARHFLVVDDPVPGGLEPVNRDLATASRFDADKGDFEAAGGSFWFTFSDWRAYHASRWNFYHKELRHDSVRFYSDYLPAGNYHLSYTAQAVAEGEFRMLPVFAGEMYDADVFGTGLPGRLTVAETP